MRLLDISIDDISLQDERFRFSYYFDTKRLVDSIKKIGLLSPLLVVKRNDSPYIMASGWKRVLACFELSMTQVPAFVIEEKEDYRVFLISLYENWAFRSFDLLEKAEVLHRLNGFLKNEKKIAEEFFPLLGIPANLSYLDIYLKIAVLEPAWKKIIYQKKIPLSTIRFLTELTPEERKKLAPMVLPLNVNKLKQFIQDLFELSQKTGDSVLILLSTPEILSVSRSNKLTAQQKAEKVRSLVWAARYPALSAWKKAFDASIRKARLGKEVIFDAASFFEDGEFAVRFSLHDREAFVKRVAKLQKLVTDEVLFSLFEDFSDG